MSLLFRLLPGTVVLLGSAALILLSPTLTLASEGSAEFFVSAWLVRIWLALVSGTVIVVGVMLALDSYSNQGTLEPVITPDSKVAIVKQKKLSYKKIGGGLLCVCVGCALFVTSVFLLPDKRTGHSGIGKIIKRFSTEQVVVDHKTDSGVSEH